MTEGFYVGNSRFQAELKAATNGDVDAMVYVAQSLSASARHTGSDDHVPDTARAWFEKAIATGSTQAVIALALEEHAFGDVAEACETIRRAVPSGEPDVFYNLGGMLSSAGLDDGPDGSYAWLGRAGDAGHGDAMCMLGNLHDRDGRPDEARDWWIRAADVGNADAMYNLMKVAVNAGDFDGAASWINRAIALGHPPTLLLWAEMLERDGVIDGEGGARFYYEEAARLGLADAQAALKRLGNSGTLSD